MSLISCTATLPACSTDFRPFAAFALICILPSIFSCFVTSLISVTPSSVTDLICVLPCSASCWILRLPCWTSARTSARMARFTSLSGISYVKYTLQDLLAHSYRLMKGTKNSLPKTDETFFGLRFKWTGRPVIFRDQNIKQNLVTQMTQPVRRNYEVLIERSAGSFTNRAAGA